MNPWARLKEAAHGLMDYEAGTNGTMQDGLFLLVPNGIVAELRAALAALPADAPSEAPLLDELKALRACCGDGIWVSRRLDQIIAAAEARQAAKPLEPGVNTAMAALRRLKAEAEAWDCPEGFWPLFAAIEREIEEIQDAHAGDATLLGMRNDELHDYVWTEHEVWSKAVFGSRDLAQRIAGGEGNEAFVRRVRITVED